MAIALSGNNANVSVTTTTPTITAETAGNTLVLWIANFRSPAARTVTSIATTNVAWVKLCGTTNGVMGAEIWYGTVAGGSSGTAVTITMSGTGATLAGRITGYSGVLTTGTINDGTGVTKTGTSTGPTTAAFSPPSGNDLLLTCVGYNSGTTPSATPGGVWTDTTFTANSTTNGMLGAYDLIGVTGAASAAWTIGNVAWVTCLGALKVTPKTSTLTAATVAQSAAVLRGKIIPAATVAQGAALVRGRFAVGAMGYFRAYLTVPASGVFTKQARIPQDAATVAPSASMSRTGKKILASVSAACSAAISAAKAGTLFTQSLAAATTAWGALISRMTGKPSTAATAAMSATNIRTGKKTLTAASVAPAATITKQDKKKVDAS